MVGIEFQIKSEGTNSEFIYKLVNKIKGKSIIYDEQWLKMLLMTGIFQVGIGDASTAREAPASTAVTCDEMQDHHHHTRPHHMAHEPHHHHQHQQQHHHAHHPHQIATTAFHISRPSHPISTIISPPPLHHTSIILDQDSYNVSRIMLQNENFQVKQTKPFSLFFLLIIYLYLISESSLSLSAMHAWCLYNKWQTESVGFFFLFIINF